jgi:SAM-dependent methyltransferase
MDVRDHWERIYRTRRIDEMSWFQRDPVISLALVRRAAPDCSARVIDVGAGASSLVDGLLHAGYGGITVLDVSATALEHARGRLGVQALRVTWLEADVRTAALPAGAYDVWHDRAVFHFLTNPDDRAAYVAQVRRTLRAGGHAIVATFAEDGPPTCSGLPVVRYSPESLHAALGEGFVLVTSGRDQHVTPGGATQRFVYGLLRRSDQ